MKEATRNVRIFAENAEATHGFNIFLDFSGQREFLMFHRHNGLAYNLLKDGIKVDDLQRIDPFKVLASGQFSRRSNRRKSDYLTHTLDHISLAVSDYLEERNGHLSPCRAYTQGNTRFSNSGYDAA